MGPSGDKGMPEAEASKDIRNSHMCRRIKIRTLKNRLLKSMTAEFYVWTDQARDSIHQLLCQV